MNEIRKSDEVLMVSVIIPCRNEEKFIRECLDSVLANDYPGDKLEILVVDGMSDDMTKDIVLEYSEKYSFVSLYNNNCKIVPTALNIGIKKAKGDVIMRIDAHNIYSNDYISKCVKYLQKYNVDNVGGIWITLPGKDSIMCSAIAFGLSHPFGVGNAHFRLESKQPKYVDTVPFGCYKREVFNKIGLFDEDLVRNQDDEFNLRLIKNGGKILLVPDIISYYCARDSIVKLWKMYFQYGYFKPLVVKKIKAVLTWRQLVPVFFVSILTISFLFSLISYQYSWSFFSILLIYLVANSALSLSIAINKGLKYFLVLPIVFATLHFSYGFGYLKGILDFIVFGRHKKNKIKDVQLTR